MEDLYKRERKQPEREERKGRERERRVDMGGK